MNTQKPGIKTTEFWLSLVAALVGVLISTGLIDPEGTTGIDQVAGIIVTGLASAGYAHSRGNVKKNAGHASVGLLIAAALTLTLLPSCGIFESVQGVDPQYLKGDRATYESIGEEWWNYVDQDDALTVDQKARRELLLESWKVRLESAEEAAGVQR